MHNSSTNRKLVVTTADSSAFRGEASGDSRFYIFGTLGSGLLRFEVVAELATGERSAVSGTEFFAAMMDHFGVAARVIEGNWTKASGLTTNIDQFNQATAAGSSPEDAAALTWTGRQATSHGYTKVTVINASPPGADGNYDSARVHFGRQ